VSMHVGMVAPRKGSILEAEGDVEAPVTDGGDELVGASDNSLRAEPAFPAHSVPSRAQTSTRGTARSRAGVL
jgi:hypothetical protein